MSHKTEIEVNIDDRDALKEALTEMGFTVREGKHELGAFGWKMECDLSIKKKDRQLNIGFSEQEDGTYKVEADWWGTGLDQQKFRDDLNQLHSKHKASNWLRKNKYKVSYEQEEDGSIVVVGTRWAS
jgi:uncharacterized membrane protein YfhO